MPKRDKRQIRLLFLGSLIIFLVFIYISQVWLFPTLSRYIVQEKDEIKGYYSELYISSKSNEQVIALENNAGYIEFELRNYIEENVTQHEIEYTVSKPSTFYNSSGAAIADVATYLSNQSNKLYVLDSKGNPQEVERSTYYYDVEIVNSTGIYVSDGIYSFSHERLGTKIKAQSHSVTCQVTRTDGKPPLSDTISIVVQLTKPYKEILIIKANIANKLISFSLKEEKIYDSSFEKINIQTADIFSNNKDGSSSNKSANIYSDTYYQYTPYAFKLTIKWSGYIFDETNLEGIHIGTSTAVGSNRENDGADSNGVNKEDGNTPNATDEIYLDILKSTISKINSTYSEKKGQQGELVIYIPQGSEISLNFLKVASSGTIDVKIETYVTYVLHGSPVTSRYELYDRNIFNGYEHENGFYNITNYGS